MITEPLGRVRVTIPPVSARAPWLAVSSAGFEAPLTPMEGPATAPAGRHISPDIRAAARTREESCFPLFMLGCSFLIGFEGEGTGGACAPSLPLELYGRKRVLPIDYDALRRMNV